MAAASSNSVLASIFILSLLLLLLVPYTLYFFFGGKSSEKKAAASGAGLRLSALQAWLRSLDVTHRRLTQPEQEKKAASNARSSLSTPGLLAIVALWLVVGLLIFHIRSAAEEVRPFDPFEILGVTTASTEREIKRAYRQLSLKFHPDKNPDPAAATYFAEFISPAYKALTDETARANLEKHGHPDGPQGVSIGVALPAFLFEKGRAAPIVLACIVGVGILLPLSAVVYYIIAQSKYTNNVLQQTLGTFFMLTESKNSLAASKVADILSCASEYIQLPVRRADDEPLQRLAAELRSELDTKDPKFLKLHPAIKKSRILLAAQMVQREVTIPEEIVPDFLSIMSLAPTMLEELLKISIRPRPPLGHAWLRPVLSVLEYNQSLTQALSISSRGASATGDAAQSLLQLPHMDTSMLKKLARSKVRSLGELLLLSDDQRDAALSALELEESRRTDIQQLLGAVPSISLAATCETEGEEGTDVLEGDFATCTVHVCLERLASKTAARTPYFPANKEEGWWLLLADTASNSLLVAQKVRLDSKVGLKNYAQPAEQGASSVQRESWQRVNLKFHVPAAGLHFLQVICMSDYWIGCDARFSLKLKVLKPKVDKEGLAEAQRKPSDDNEAVEGSDGEVDETADGDLTESGTSESDGEA